MVFKKKGIDFLMFKIGNKVLFSTGTIEELKCNLGIIIDAKDDKFVVLNRSYNSNSIYSLKEIYLENIANVDKVRQDISEYYNSQIKELKSKLRKTTSEEKIQERVEKYNNTKNMILKNCERIVICTDDDEFENRLKEINRLNKILHAINLECGDIIRKENGRIKYDIRNIEKQMNGCLNSISDEAIIKMNQYR